ncbi:PREDICTED: UBP1-associated protein 2C-like isoform X2 [Camelina sativa]|uniref:UBP1-associated protein 2C-like isoform X1 n=2 Tax=Camelina sativa TaxID=90675 RepID=A0ABM0VZ57_CAMSA|nr:PREDICTED: UBP1-associated protein 2C-like isoform X1 [Camelina sativa]XP_019091746.1 PREDICTED: UBP1-associated protein 2C-like isoform X2 [Camelina sativa]
MDMLKKRKLDENGIAMLNEGVIGAVSSRLMPHDARKIIERFSTDQLLDILQEAVVRHPDILEIVRSTADSDISQRKLFIRGLAAETTTEGLRSLFSNYGDLEEAIVILDKVTAKSKGYGFVTFKHVDGALLALKEPSKKIDGRVTVTQLAAAGNQGTTNSHVTDISMRKIYVANVPFDMPADRLLNQFLAYGDIEEGPLGFDKITGKSRGFALFVYKTAEGAQAALAEPMKVVDGKNLQCKLAIDGKKGKPPGQDGGAGVGHGHGHGHGHGEGMGMVPPSGPYGAATGGHGGPAGLGTYGGYSGGGPHHMNSTPSSVGVAAAGGYGGAYGGHYSAYGGAGTGAYGGLGAGSMGVSGGAYGPGSGSGAYRMPPSSMSGGGYPESGHYGHSSASAYPGQHQPVGSSPVPRVSLGGMYPNGPPNY